MFSTNTLRRLSALVLLTFTSLTLQPLQAAVQNHPAQSRAQSAPTSRAENASRLLDAIKETAKRAKDKADKRLSTRETVKELRRQKSQLDALEQEVLDDFSATEAHLKAKNLPPEIINRHRAAVQDYKTKQSEFKRQLKTLEADDDRDDENARATGVTNLAAWLTKNQPDKQHAKTDPHKLPFRTPDAKVRPPVETEQDYRVQNVPQPKSANRFAAVGGGQNPRKTGGIGVLPGFYRSVIVRGGVNMP